MHFLTEPDDYIKYSELVNKYVSLNGYVLISAFSTDGPQKCSGLTIRQYDEASLQDLLGLNFEPIDFQRFIHFTPWGSEQKFICGLFQKIK